jgi:hypothetical protein
MRTVSELGSRITVVSHLPVSTTVAHCGLNVQPAGGPHVAVSRILDAIPSDSVNGLHVLLDGL